MSRDAQHSPVQPAQHQARGRSGPAAHVDFTLYVLTDRRYTGDNPAPAVEAAIRGGATLVQLREKGVTTREALRAGEAVLEVCRRWNVPLIINDRVDLMLALDADGVHLGPDDMPLAKAREIIGPHKIIGASAGTPEEARRAWEDGADYLGIGAVYATGSKDDAGEPIGVQGFIRVRQAAPLLPAVAIAGINESNAAALMEAGADGVAVISAVFATGDPEQAARRLRQALARGARQALNR